jgi:tetratricopeptide (TPR) repeat protein
VQEKSNRNPLVMISSTARDLPEHREKVMHACLRLGMFYPEMMEHLSAADANAVEVSLRMVEDAEVYLGVFGFRYGYVPPGADASITETEYDRAVERGIPRLIFLMHDDHPLRATDVETGAGAEKLKALKERLKADRVVAFFKSPDELLALVIQSLSELRRPDLTTFHYVSDIPEPPEAFIAHPYTLLQTHRLVGRQPELNLLTDWVAKPGSDVYKARILNVVAVGGMGKSALTWTWFRDIAPQEMKPLSGRMWWSFYESDATFENFVTRALAYVTRHTLAEVQQIPAPDRETQLLAALDRDPFLLALDGLERILIAYARMDAARLEDSEVGTQRNLRKTAEPRAGRFLKKLTQLKNSRILVSTRLHPAELETEGGDSTPDTFRLDITGLADEDAIELWRALNVTGSRDLLLPVFDTFGRHPLLIQALAGEVKRYRRAPGNFEEWRRANPRFDPTRLPHLHEAMSHVLEFALSGLGENAHQVLHTIAAFRMPARYDTLAALFMGNGKACADGRELDEVLTELEDRGLVGWDKRANRYDLHPIVRGVVWSGLEGGSQRAVYTSLRAHFEALLKSEDYLKADSLEDLTPAIELYNTLVGLGRFDDAGRLFSGKFGIALHYRLSANRQMIELLEMLFPDGLDAPPRLGNLSHQAFTINALALGCRLTGQLARAGSLYMHHNKIYSEIGHYDNLSTGLRNLSDTLWKQGSLYRAEGVARQALNLTRGRRNYFKEAISLRLLGLILSARGVINESEIALKRALRILATKTEAQAKGTVYSYLAQRALWSKEFTSGLTLANRAWEFANIAELERDFIRAARRQGAAALGLKDFAMADERLHHALSRARTVSHVEEEIHVLVALAELRRRQGDLNAARELLEDVWEAAERGPYPLFHADACNVLAEIERDEGNVEGAVEAARKAYGLAWCDGPPFAYHWGLEKSRALLRESGAGEPVLPPFDESRFQPMPEVEIDTADEFGAGGGGEAEPED